MQRHPSAAVEEASAPVLDIDGARATIRLNRPKHLNRLQPGDLDTLLKLFDRIESDPAIRVMVLTGTGRAFSSGYDLGSIAERAANAQEQTAGSAFEIVVNRLEDLAVPTICRINGGVYGGSTDLALACDFRIGVDSCEMFMPAARLGLHYYRSGIKRYVSRLGVDNAKKLFLTAQKIGAAEMLRIGYRPPTAAIATACAAPRSRKACERSRKNVRRSSAHSSQGRHVPQIDLGSVEPLS